MDVLQIRIGAEPVKEQGDLFGIFFEDLNHAADGGLYGELVQNRSFEFDPVDNPAYHALTAWEPINRGSSIGVCHVESHSPLNTKNPHYLILESTKAGNGSGVRNIGYNGGIPVEEGKTYRFSCWVRRAGRNTCSLRIQLETEDGISLSECEVLPVHSGEWTRQECLLTACGTDHSARLAIFMTESGTVALDMVSLFPSDTYKGRPNGMRKDIAELLEAMHPKFMRFPGGCLVHDGSLDENDRVSMYRWKNTIGPLESRPARRNNWGYHQTLGLGYYEYFQFCEDIGAKPLPVLPGGWDPHHQRAVPLEELTSWVDDALDLIEFANGGVDTKWGAVRAELGHPEPFGLEYLAIGNEEVGQGFFERFERFYSAIRARAPEIKIIGTSGPFAAGGEYTRGWKYARELGVDLVDEHYYQAPEWFQANIHRYDNFPEDGPKVFLGEYASQGNMWYNAVTEAAYMIGLEKAPAVGLACYAPMLCNVNYVNWKPDMIFFDNHRAYGTPNYYVQKLFMLHQGDALLPLEGLSVQPSTISQPLAGPVIMRAGSSEFAVSNLRLTEANKTKYLPDFVLAMGQEAAIGHTDGGDFTLEWDAVELRHEPSKGEYGNCGLRLQFGNNISDEAMEWSLGGWQNSDSIINRFYGGKGTCRSQSEFSFLVGQRRHFLLKGSGRKILAFIDGESCHDVEDRLPQLEPLYASACLNRSSRTVVIKVVNLCGDAQIAAIDLPEWVERSMKGRKTTMAYAPEAENDFDRPENVVPVDEPFFMNGTELRHTFPPCSLTIFDIVIEK